MLGAILGDIVGSPFEFDHNNYKHKDFALLSEKSHFTDDTVMTVAVARGLMAGQGDAPKTFAEVQHEIESVPGELEHALRGHFCFSLSFPQGKIMVYWTQSHKMGGTVMKWGILATGTIAKKFASTVEQMGAEGERIVAVGSRHLESAQAFAQQYGIPRCYDSYEALAADPEKVETKEVHINEYGTDDYSRLALTYPGGCKAESVQTIGQELERNARIVGTKGSIFLPDFQHAETMTLEVEGKEPEVIRCPVDINGFEYEIREASRCVKLGRTGSDRYTPQDSLALTRLMYDTRMSWGMKFAGEV